MTRDAATIAVVVALASGFYGAQLLRAADDHRTAKLRLAAAAKALWQALRLAAVVAVVVIAAVDLWLHGHGHR